MKKRILALAMATAMLVGLMSTTAMAAGGSGTVALTTTVTAPKYVLGVPKAAPVVLNPYMVGTDPVGIKSPTLSFVNSSDLPVIVNVSLIPKIAAAAEVVGLATSTDTGFTEHAPKIDNARSNTGKQIFMYAQFPATTVVSSPGATLVPADSNFTWEGGKPLGHETTLGTHDTKNYKIFNTGTAATKGLLSTDFAFALDKAIYDNTGKITTIGVDCLAGFRIMGDVNAYGNWAATDFGVNLVYDAETILPTELTSVKTEARLGEASATSVLTFNSVDAGVVGFSNRQINMKSNDTDGIDLTSDINLIGTTDTPAYFTAYTNATGTTALASTAPVELSTAGVITTKATFAAVTTIYIKCQVTDADGAVIGIFPITINPVK